MNTKDDIQLHDLEIIEANLSTEGPSEGEDSFMITSASGFMITSASGFMIT
jgi:hypothetical protein